MACRTVVVSRIFDEREYHVLFDLAVLEVEFIPLNAICSRPDQAAEEGRRVCQLELTSLDRLQARFIIRTVDMAQEAVHFHGAGGLPIPTFGLTCRRVQAIAFS